jgi:hypothetical protein
MRLVKRAVVVVLLTALALPSTLASQDVADPENPLLIPGDNTSFGGVSGEFLQLGSSARGMALGGSFATIVDDVNSLYYNPAGLPRMDGFEASVTIMPYFADTDYYWAGLAFPFADGDFGIGFFLGRFGFGDAPVYTEEDPENFTGQTFGANEVVAGASFAHQFIDRFSAGVTLKVVSDDLATGSPGGASASAFAVDLGTNFTSEVFGRRIALSFVVQNLGGNLQHSGDALSFRQVDERATTPDQRLDPPLNETRATPYPLPRLFRAGLGYDLVTSEQARWTLAAEFIESNNTKVTFGAGTEFAWESTDAPIGAALRASWQLQPDEDDLGTGLSPVPDNRGLDGLNAGGGLFYRVADRYKIQFDYAYRHFGALGSIDVFTVTFGIQ